ncbi:MAG: 50S ribosomal protein L9 [Clostridiales bacterium]|nr:50S ribosomal protein L9 [Clostridiales bacterium]MDU1042655.1 50S ribosomal protein L9 [Clostridiales bacterium]MDU3489567.1 50S ribosomal protein L9 [Clostridiales bacterium]
MKIILLEDVKALGKKGEVVEVSDGYARNFILPKKLGKEASAGNLSELKDSQAKAARIAAEELEAAKQEAARLEAQTVIIKVKIGENGKTFGAVSSKEIAEDLKVQTGMTVDKKKMKLDEPIKAPGTYSVPVKLHRDVTGTLKVVVEEEK